MRIRDTDFTTSIGQGFLSDETDVKKARHLFKTIGYESGEEDFGYPDKKLEGAIRNFQRDNKLKEDGIMHPDGKTKTKLNQKIKEKLPAPTTKPINKEKYYDLLEYDLNKGGGDLHSFFQYGIGPDKIAKRAGKKAKEELPNYKGYADDQDAFRHALGGYFMAERYGAKKAKSILDRHERSPMGGLSPQDIPESGLQDIYNNQVGINAYLKEKSSNKKAEDIIRKLYKDGRLQTRPFSLEKNKK